MKNVLTHNGKFHADDVFAIATLDLVFKGKIKIIRSRETKDIQSADIVVDVGMIYDPETNRYDHHQKDGAGQRPNGVPYASFGLIWKHFAHYLISDQSIIDDIDQRIVSSIDAVDNGYEDFYIKSKNISAYSPDKIVESFNPNWKENYSESFDRFIEMVQWAKTIISREIVNAEARKEGRIQVQSAYIKAKDKRLVILERGYPWKDFLCEQEDTWFVVYPDMTVGNWNAQTVPINKKTFECKVYFPENWRGLKDHDLAHVSGVKDSVFCHNKGFLAVAQSREGAIKLAEQAIINQNKK